MMIREDIIKLAREAGLADSNGVVHAFYQLERFAALVAEHERQRIIAANAPEIEKINAHIKTLAAEREKVAQWMMTKGYATGHGDSIEDLLKELEWQIRESEREACAKVCDKEELHLQAAAYANERRETYLGRMKQGLTEELSEEMINWLWVAHYEGWRDAVQETKHGH